MCRSIRIKSIFSECVGYPMVDIGGVSWSEVCIIFLRFNFYHSSSNVLELYSVVYFAFQVICKRNGIERNRRRKERERSISWRWKVVDLDARNRRTSQIVEYIFFNTSKASSRLETTDLFSSYNTCPHSTHLCYLPWLSQSLRHSACHLPYDFLFSLTS